MAAQAGDSKVALHPRLSWLGAGRRAKEFRDCAATYQKECHLRGPEVPAVIEMLTSVKLSQKVLAQCRELRRPDQDRYA